MATLEIVFLGLIAFAPDPAGKQLWALMPKTSDYSPCGTANKLDYPVHTPGLAFPFNAPVAATGLCPSKVNQNGYWIYDISGYSVQVNAPVASPSLQYPRRPPGANLGYPESASEFLAIDWLARIADISPKQAFAARDCFNSPSTTCQLSARVLVSHGTVETECLVKRSGECKEHWQHPTKKEPTAQTYCFAYPKDCPLGPKDTALNEGTRVVMADIPDHSAVTFTLVPLQSGQVCTLSVGLTTGAMRAAILHQAIAHNGWQPEALCDGSAPAPHPMAFQFFYRLSEGGCNDKSIIPFPSKVCGPAATPRCPQAQFEHP